MLEVCGLMKMITLQCIYDNYAWRYQRYTQVNQMLKICEIVQLLILKEKEDDKTQ